MLDLKQSADPQHAERREAGDSTQIGLAHRVYSLGLDRLVGERTEGGPEAVGLRGYESTDGAAAAFFDVDESDEGSVRLVHILPVIQSCVCFESPRSTETLWVSHESGEWDLLLPLTGVGRSASAQNTAMRMPSKPPPGRGPSIGGYG